MDEVESENAHFFFYCKCSKTITKGMQLTIKPSPAGINVIRNNNTYHCIRISREHPGLNRGQSDLQSDALPLSYAPCYVMPWRYKV